MKLSTTICSIYVRLDCFLHGITNIVSLARYVYARVFCVDSEIILTVILTPWTVYPGCCTYGDQAVLGHGVVPQGAMGREHEFAVCDASERGGLKAL